MTNPIWDDRPTLRRPVLVAGFRGWNDAANAASDTLAWLSTRLGARPFAHLDPQPFYDFQSTRPTVVLQRGVATQIVWPVNEFLAARAPGTPHDFVFVQGSEPNLRWREFCAAIVRVAETLNAELVVTLGALLADTPHTRPLTITGTATDPDLISRLGLERSRYEGPTGIVGVLHDACRRAGLASASLWAPVPHYVASPPNPAAIRELVARLTTLTGLHVDLTELDLAAQGWRDRVSAAVAGDPETQTYVHELETRFDTVADGRDADELPSGEDLAAELERYLRDRRDQRDD
ncbi:MAG TPA: PAC2 family protein [Acidimicrobiia bacterium]|nr:PAC2 family protein [Acidimicrobiia bacterium]